MRFVLKADDDAFINVPALVRELKANCLSFGCRKERMYFGREIRNNVVRVAAGDKWQVMSDLRRRMDGIEIVQRLLMFCTLKPLSMHVQTWVRNRARSDRIPGLVCVADPAWTLTSQLCHRQPAPRL